MITEQEPALEFILLHIYYYIFISDFWAKGRRVYRSTNQVWSYGYMCSYPNESHAWVIFLDRIFPQSVCLSDPHVVHGRLCEIKLCS